MAQPGTQRDILKQVSDLRKTSPDQARALLRDVLRRGLLDAQGVEKAGRMLRALPADQSVKILLLAQCTGTWVANMLTAIAWAHGTALAVHEGGYDNVAQDLLSFAAPECPDIVVLLPWHQRLLAPEIDLPPAARVEDECEFWAKAWTITKERLGARILQVSYDWITPGPQGYCLGAKGTGPVALVRQVNRRLQERLPEDAYFVDLEQVSGELGRRHFYDARSYYWTKQPFSDAGTQRLAEHLWAGIRALVTSPKKVLALDLDNTLWGGVVGETGPMGIGLGQGPEGEAFTAFQKYVKALGQRGIVLAVCSKNNPADAREAFATNPDMALSLTDFAQFEASWDPKDVALKRIASALGLGLDSIVFFDDNPAEREHIRQALPEVAVPDVPEDPAEFIQALEAGLWFETTRLTKEDFERANLYQVENARRAQEASFTSLDEYLASLSMQADVRPVSDANLDRVVQLMGKTNQFNLTTRRHSGAQVRAMLARKNAVNLTMRLADRFGDYGLVSVILAVPSETDECALRIDTWLMSCRVIGRTAEEFLFTRLLAEARERGYRRLIGEYIPTAKNALVSGLYERFGFLRADGAEDQQVYVLDVGRAEPPVSHIVPKPLAEDIAPGDRSMTAARLAG